MITNFRFCNFTVDLDCHESFKKPKLKIALILRTDGVGTVCYKSFA